MHVAKAISSIFYTTYTHPHRHGPGTHTARGCTATFAVTYGIALAYGVDAAVCTVSDAAHSPTVFCVHTADAHAVVFCMRTVEVLNVSVELVLQTGDDGCGQVGRSVELAQ